MERRLKLQEFLEDLLGSPNVYFQPPASKELDYPAIVYKLENIDDKFANNKVYLFKKQYSLTIIDEDPDSGIIEKVINLPLCQFVRHYNSDNLNHDVFNIYY